MMLRTAGRRIATTTRQTTATTTLAFAFPAHGNGPMRCVYECSARTKALTSAPDLFRHWPDEYDILGGGW